MLYQFPLGRALRSGKVKFVNCSGFTIKNKQLTVTGSGGLSATPVKFLFSILMLWLFAAIAYAQTPDIIIGPWNSPASEAGSATGEYLFTSDIRLESGSVTVNLTTPDHSTANLSATLNSDYTLSVGSSVGWMTQSVDADFNSGDVSDNAAVGEADLGSKYAADSVGLLPASFSYDGPPSVDSISNTTQFYGTPGGAGNYRSSYVVARPGGGYRLYYDKIGGTGGSYQHLAYVDTTDSSMPNSTNLGPEVLLGVGGVLADTASKPQVFPLPGGGYRLYHDRYNGSYNEIGYRETLDGNLPNETNLGPFVSVVCGVSCSAYYGSIFQLPSGHYRVYYGNSNGYYLWYQDTLDTNLPNATNMDSSVITAGTGRYHRGVDIEPLPDGKYRMYYGSSYNVYYMDTTDSIFPTSSNLGTTPAQLIGDHRYGAINVFPLDTPVGAYRAIFTYRLSPFELAYRDSLQVPTYNTSGSFTSSIMDLSAAFDLTTVDFSTTIPTNTTLTVDVRAGNSPTIDGTWTTWQTGVSSGDNIVAPGTYRYFQYKVWFTTADTAVTPLLTSLTVNYDAGTPVLSGPGTGAKSLVHTDYSDFGTGDLWDAVILEEGVQLGYSGLLTGAEDGLTTLRSLDNSWSADSGPNARNSYFRSGHSKFVSDPLRGTHSAYFDGSSDYVRINDFPELGVSDQPYTIEGWMKTDASETNGVLVHTSSSTNGSGSCFSPVVLASGALRAHSLNSGLVTATGTTIVNDGKWHHFATTWDPVGGLRLYLDGVLEAHTPQANFTSSGLNNYFFLARHYTSLCGSNGWYKGNLDEVAVFSRALSAEEIAERVKLSMSGVYTSSVIDLGVSLGAVTVDYTSSTPIGTSLEVDVRAADSYDFLTNATVWVTNIASGANVSSTFGSRRYVQYRVRMSTNDEALTPRLEDVSFNYMGYSDPEALQLTLPIGSVKTWLTLTPIDDIEDELDEHAILSIQTGSGYNLGSTVSTTVIISDNDINLVTVSPYVDGKEQGGAPGYFKISRAGELDSSLTVNYTVSGTAVAGSDYTALSGSVVLPAGSGVGTNSESVVFVPINDASIEGAETITLTLTPDATYVIAPDNQATLNIIDNDTDGSARPDDSGIFIQTNWGNVPPEDGVSCTSLGGTWNGSSCIGVHTANRDEWSSYSSVGTVVDAVGTPGQVTLTPKLQTWTQTNEGYTDSGFWAAGYQTTGFATVAGFGDDADITLAPIDVGDGSDGAFDSETYNGTSIAGITGTAPSITIDTDAVTHLGVYNFTDFKVAEGHTITVNGSNPLQLFVQLDTKVDGVIRVWAAGGEGGDQVIVTGGVQGLLGEGVDPEGEGGGGPAERLDDDTPIQPWMSHGGGGGHGAPGLDGSTSDPVNYPAGLGGAAYGDEEITVLYGGSGGGAAFYNRTICINWSPGGDGGGAVMIKSGSSISVGATGQINVNGGAGTNAGSWSSRGSCPGGSRGASGAGAGGSIKLIATNIVFASGDNRASAEGGIGGSSGAGGHGGGGRIRLEAVNFVGETNSSAGTGTNTTAALAESFVSAGSGTFISRIQYMGYVDGVIAAPGVWGTMEWNATIPSGATLDMYVRSCEQLDCSDRSDIDWSVPVSGQDLSSLAFVEDAHAYIQYKVDMTTSGEVLPRLHDVTINTINYGGQVWFQIDDTTSESGFNMSGSVLDTVIVSGNGDNALVSLNSFAGTGADADFDSGTYDGSSIPGITGLKPSIVIDTSDLTRNGSYNFSSFTIREGDTVRVRGANPLILKVLGDMKIDGKLDASGYSGDANGFKGIAGPGGSDGGSNCGDGSGLGGGIASTVETGTGAGGGSHASLGTAGGESYGFDGGLAGGAYGDALLPTLEGGSGGGGATAPSGGCANGEIGGGGGGAVEIAVGGTLSVGGLGLISVNGGDGGSSPYTSIYNGGGGGGGSAGSLKIFSDLIILNNPIESLSARGGFGGVSYFFADGGDGGDGRIHVTASTIQGETSINYGNGTLVTDTPVAGTVDYGTYYSGIYDAGSPVSWETVFWDAASPSGSTITLSFRSCTVDDCSDRGVSDWSSATNGVNLPSLSFVENGHQYLQYRAEMSSDRRTLPALRSIAVNVRQNLGGATMTSSVYDTEDNNNEIRALEWVADTSDPGTSLKFQLRTSPNGTSWGAWYGPTSTNDFYTVSGSSINAVHTDGVDDRYVQYQVTLSSTNEEYTPILQDVTLKYITFGSGAVVSNFGPFGADVNYQNSQGSSSSGGGGALSALLILLMIVALRRRQGVVTLLLVSLSESIYAQYVLDLDDANRIDGAGYRVFTVGNINSDFYQEIIMQTGFGYFQGGSATASGGAGGPGGNGTDPLGFGGADNATFVGNGIGNPTKVIIWQRNKDDEMLLDFLKDKLDMKPRITQTITNDQLLSEFGIDMRTIDYNTDTVEGDVTNRLTLPANGYMGIDWDVDDNSKTDWRDIDVTAGEYTWAPGGNRAGSDGTYTYANGGVMDPNEIDWAMFFQPEDPSNVWSISTNKPPAD